MMWLAKKRLGSLLAFKPCETLCSLPTLTGKTGAPSSLMMEPLFYVIKSLDSNIIFQTLDKQFPLCYTSPRIDGRSAFRMDSGGSNKSWDDSLKSLVNDNPQAFILWLLGKGQYKEKLPYKLKMWRLEVDALLKVEVEDEEMLLHIEFQTYHDSTMDERLLRYNVLARSEYGLPVLSYVIYLLKDGIITKSPLSWRIPGGREVLQFHFESIELGDITPEELIEVGQPGLLPLLPLTKGGIRREVTNMMFASLQAAQKPELIPIGGTLAAYMLSRANPDDLAWLRRRLREMHDIIRESPYYQEILEEGREEGLEKGRALERYEQLEALRQTVINIVLGRFPGLLRFARKQVAVVDDLATMRGLIVELSLAETQEEAKQTLEKVDENEYES